MPDALTLTAIGLTFLLAGTVKGVIGLGLPTVALAVLTVALGLPRDALIQAMGMLFTVSTAALGVALAGRGLVSGEFGVVSAAAVLPALLGMALGQRLRRAMSEALFRKVFFTALLALGLYILARAAS